MITRRAFLDTLAVGTAGFAVSSSAKSYARILGSNDRINFGIIGLNSRAYGHLEALKANQQNIQVTHVCDVDSVVLGKFAAKTKATFGYDVLTDKDYRKMVQLKDVDAISIATPDHLHTPISIAALQAGKHVYVEKPCSFDPHEGKLLVAAQAKYGLLVQMGNQGRSLPHIKEIIEKIHNGLIGRANFARAWYVNNRKSIGIGKEIAPPPTLDWELWQGPAPRRAYRSNLHPYNWHWFRIYGTGEALNNGTHEIDICRWALQVDLPKNLNASGGKYVFQDDWEFYDTLVANWAYDDKMISWENRSRTPIQEFGRDRGSHIMGTDGSVIVNMGGYEVFDQSGKKTDEFKLSSVKTASNDLIGLSTAAGTNLHFANFIAGIQRGEKLNSPIAEGNLAVTMLQLTNIAWETGLTLNLDPETGKIINSDIAQKMTHREYEKGWEPTL